MFGSNVVVERDDSDRIYTGMKAIFSTTSYYIHPMKMIETVIPTLVASAKAYFKG